MSKEKELSLLDIIPTNWEEFGWKGMPEYQHQDLRPLRSILVHLANAEDVAAFSKLVGQNFTSKTKSIWYPKAEIDHFVDKVYRSAEPRNLRYPVYVISKGRWESRLTVKHLETLGVPYHVVVEPQEYDQYAAVISPENILTLPFSNLGQGSIPARNWVWEHSLAAGAARHWIIDDNIDGFFYFQDNLKTPVGDGTIFAAMEDYVDRYENIALAGPNYFMFVIRKSKIPPITMNTRIYSCILINNAVMHRWRGRYNEDTDLSIRVLKDGMVTVLFNAFLGMKQTTMTMKGGNTDELYVDDGRLLMAQSLQEQHPDIVSITEKWGPQHHVNYAQFKFNRAIPKPGAEALNLDSLLILEKKAPAAASSVVSDIAAPFKPVTLVPPAPATLAPSPFPAPLPARSAPVVAGPRAIRASAVTGTAAMPVSSWTVPNLDEIPSFADVKILGFDTEYHDPDLRKLGPGVRRDGRLIGISFSCEAGSWYLPFGHEGGDNLDRNKVLAFLQAKTREFRGELCGLNLITDLDYVAQNGIEFDDSVVLRDVGVIEALLDENRPEFTLDAISLSHLGIGKDEQLLRAAATAHGWSDPKVVMHRLPARYVGPYAEADASRPWHIWEKQRSLIESDGLGQVCEIECRLTTVLFRMLRAGVRVSTTRNEEVMRDISIRRDACISKMRSLSNPSAELMAPESFAQSLVDRGFDLPQTPKTGKPSVRKEWLADNAGDALVDTILEGRKLDKLINTFLSSIDRFAIPDGNGFGRVHAQFNQMRGEDEDGNRRGALARLSSSRPNLQQIPKRDEELGPLMRSVFRPWGEQKWYSFDLSQIEWRYLCHFAVGTGADDARRRYTEDRKTDYYRMTMELANLDPNDRRLRDGYKAVTLAKGYGASRDKLMRMCRSLGLGDSDALLIVDGLDKRLPFARETYRMAEDVATDRGYVLTIMKRRQRFPFWAPRGKGGEFAFVRDRAEAISRWGSNIGRAWSYKALNYALQGSAADHMKKAMVDYWNAGLQDILGPPLVTVHDELGISAGESPREREALDEVQNIMENCIPLKVPVLCKEEYGPSWGELT